MPYIDTDGVKVNFPFEPYPCQVDYMRSVVTCLKQGYNGVLESPTGTGKTLCLLCSSLAWLEDKKAQITSNKWRVMSSEPEQAALDVFKSDLAQQLDDAAGQWAGEVAPPKIIYASRTHSQLTQVVQELKRTAYSHFRVCILGSREQMCIHPQVLKEESNTVKVHMCRAKVSARSCHFYNGVENAKANFTNKIMDIEDLVTMGKKFNCCPYYMSRELKAEADIIFLPYNYLLDPKSRKAHGLELQGNVVIFDEAHNLEKMCEESTSFDLTSAEIAAAVREIDHISGRLQELMASEEGSGFGGDNPASSNDFTLEDVLQVKTLENELDQISLPRQDEGVTKPGSFIFDMFSSAKLTFGTQEQVTEVLDKLTAYLSNDSGSSAFNTKGTALSKFNDVLKIVFSQRPAEDQQALGGLQKELSRHYKVHIRYTPQDNRKKKNEGWGANAKTQKQGRTLSYWCFSPGHAMKDLMSRGVRSIILTSGTLSPMNSFKAEMAIDFKVELENPHVISEKQVWVGVVGKGPDGVDLSSAYNTRFREDYQASLGNSVVNFSRVVPHGLLLFFPSYPVMGKCIDTWQTTGVWGRVEQYKPFFVEPRNKNEFQTAMESYYDRVSDVTANGAVFAAVCRGKVSEGLDFADNNGRAVVITGLPFPPRMDPRVVLKMKYLNEAFAQNKMGLSGEEWYSQQASRAVNQAIGRVIRHRHDFGAIILCDNRFAHAKNRAQLPSWVRPYCKVYPQFGLALRDMMAFFKTATKELPAPKTKKKPVRDVACKGAHFEPTIKRDLLNAGRLRASSVVDTHVPSLQRQGSLSLGMLEQQYQTSMPDTSTAKQGATLLQALDAVEAATGGEDDDSQQSVSHQKMLRDRQETQTKTKRKIVVKGQKVSCDVAKSSLQTAEQYVTEVKKALSSTSYKLFSDAMTAYRKTEDFSQLVSRLADIFLDTPDKHVLFRNFHRFVKSHHKKEFDETCRNLTGQGCSDINFQGKKRPLSAVNSEVEKKCKIDTMEDKNTKFNDQKGNRGVIPSAVQLSSLESCNNRPCHSKEVVETARLKLKHNHEAGDATVADSVKHKDSACKETAALVDENCVDVASVHGDNNSLQEVQRDTSSLIKAKLGYKCCKCLADAVVPLEAQCKHICCMECWKAAIKESQCCPKCQQRTKRRHLRRVLFASGPSIQPK